jgi:hypothetical protein
MKGAATLVLHLVMVGACLGALAFGSLRSFAAGESLKERNEVLLEQIQRVHGLSTAQMERIREIFAHSPYIGQGNPVVTRHPVTPEQ